MPVAGEAARGGGGASVVAGLAALGSERVSAEARSMRRRRLRNAFWLLARLPAVLLLLVGLLSQATEAEEEAEAEATSQGADSAPAPAPAPAPEPSPAPSPPPPPGPGPGPGLGGGGTTSSTGMSAWPASLYYHRPIFAHQSVQSALTAIEERLRALEPPALAHAHAHARRLDALDARVARLDALLQLRIDRLAESVSARHLKEELATEQLGRSVDAAFERLHHRLGFMETRLEVALAKLQTSQDSLTTRVERLAAGLGGGCGGGGGGTDLAHLKSGLDELRKSVHENHHSLLNSTLAAVAAGDGARQRQLDSLAAALGHLQVELNRTLAVQNDAEGNGGGGGAGAGAGGGETPLRHERHASAAAATTLLGAVDRHAASFGSKVTNMYNELWRRTQILEGLAKDSMALSNATRRELQEGMRSVSMQLSRYCSLQADKAKPTSHSRDNIEATLEEIRTSTSSYFQTIISIQHMFQASCHRIQEHEPMLEKYLAETLERIVGLLTNNKWENQVEDLHRYLKSHHTTVVRNVGHTTNTVLRAANYSSKEAQNLAVAINEAHEGLLISTTDIQKGISKIQNEQQIFYQSLKEITTVMNELQNKVSHSSNQSTSEDPYLKVIQCQESNAESINMSSELKKIFEANQKHLSKEIRNLTQSITEVLRNIGVHISSHTSDNSKRSKQDFINVLTATSEDYDDTSEPDSISETLEENLNSIFDSHGPEKSSVLQNLTNSQTMPTTNKRDIKTQAPSQVETSTPQPSTSLYGTSSSQELTIIIPNAHNEIRENQSRDNNELVSNTTQENQNNLRVPLNSTIVTIVHSAKPITSEDQVTYLSSDNISTVLSNPENEHSHRQTFTDTQNNNSTGSQKSDLHDTNYTLNEMSTKNPTPFYHDINSSLVSRTEEGSREYRDLNSSFPHRITQTQDYNHHSNKNMSLHQTLQKNTSEDDRHADNHNLPPMQNPKNHSERDIHQKFPNTNIGFPRNTRHKNFNKNDTHYLYRLLNKLEELSNRLMNSESSDGSAPDNGEHTDDSQESSEENLDYSLPDSTFSSK